MITNDFGRWNCGVEGAVVEEVVWEFSLAGVWCDGVRWCVGCTVSEMRLALAQDMGRILLTCLLDVKPIRI